MLNSVFKEAIQNREKTLSILKGPKYEKIIQKAKENWVCLLYTSDAADE